MVKNLKPVQAVGKTAEPLTEIPSSEGGTLQSLVVPFNLALTDKERRAKKELKLPYLEVQKSEEAGMFVGIRKKHDVGEIFYTADEVDDLDDSDPDDDLNI